MKGLQAILRACSERHHPHPILPGKTKKVLVQKVLVQKVLVQKNHVPEFKVDIIIP